MKYFSMFSGIGGLELGIQNCYRNWRKAEKSSVDDRNTTSIKGYKWKWELPTCVGFSEIDKYAIQIYKKHFPEHKEYGDVSKIKWNSGVEDFELLCAGFPCQAFSIAGKRMGFRDTRGTLFFEILRTTQEKQPRLLLLENVKGLLSHDEGRTFGTILNTLDGLGYDLQWQVLNSKNFGVPQNRERVFIVGHLRGTSRPEVFPIEGSDREIEKKNQNRVGKSEGTIAGCLQSTKSINQNNFDGSTTLIISRPHGFNKGGKKKLPCLRSCNSFDKNEMLLNESKIRRLTPTECERLQGFPDGWTEGISDTQRYKCLGNAVTVNVIEAIMEKLI